MVILISGKQGSGKDELTRNLVTHFSTYTKKKVHSTRFAAPLYDMHDACRSILIDYGIKDYNYSEKDGTLLQLLGTEWGRNSIRESIWVDCIKGEYQKLAQNFNNPDKDLVFIVSDCRMVNEFNAFPNAVKIRLEADREARKSRCENWRDKEDHLSEVSLDQHVENGLFDIVINTGRLSKEDTLNAALEKIHDPDLIREKYGLEKILEGSGTDARPELFS